MRADGVLGIVQNNKSQVLIVKRGDIPLWCLPGGGIKKGESARAAIVREINEETSIEVSVVRQVGVGRRPDFEKKKKGGKYACAIFVCRVKKGAFKRSEELMDGRFCNKKKLPSGTIEWHKAIMKKFWNKEEIDVDMSVKKELFCAIKHQMMLLQLIRKIIKLD